MEIGILGGTGPAGRGLGLRLASAGHRVILGSRHEARAVEAANEERGRWVDRPLDLAGAENVGAAEAELVVVATPWDSAVRTARTLSGPLRDKVVVSMVNALAKEGREMLALIPPRGSMAAAVQAALPGSSVVAAFHHLPASQLADLTVGLEADVLVCADDETAMKTVAGLVESMVGLRALEAGSLGQAAAVEAFTAVCITMNIRYRAHSSVRIAGI